MTNENRTPESLFHEIANYLITHYNATGVNSQIRVTPNVKTITGTISYDFSADFTLQYQAIEKKLTLLLTSKEEGNDTTATMIYTMPEENTVQVSDSWDNKEADIATFNNSSLSGNVGLGMTYVHNILAFIEKLS